MKKHDKKRISKIRAQEKATKLVKKIRQLEQSKRDAGLSIETDGPLNYWYTVLSALKPGNIKFISAYKTRDGHLFAVKVFREALNTVHFEKAVQLEKEGG